MTWYMAFIDSCPVSEAHVQAVSQGERRGDLSGKVFGELCMFITANQKMVKDKYCLPRTDAFLVRLHDVLLFSPLDMQSCILMHQKRSCKALC